MPRRVTPVIGFVLGIFAGVGAMLATTSLDAGQAELRQQIEHQPPTRLITIPAPRGQARLEGSGRDERLLQPPPGLVFFKDVVSDGCWLAALGDRNEAIALAVAPPTACK
jgi:hypothetical protein